MKSIESKDALNVVQENYTEYSKYVAQGRSYPRIEDGAKSVYKRAIYGMWKDCPRSIIKLAKLSAAALPYHPHPTSISGVIIQLGDAGDKLKLMDTQGNWGDSTMDVKASAERYIGGMLSDDAIAMLCDSMEYTPKILGEIDEEEPRALPAYLPLCFINGQTGIPAGLPKLNIPPLNLCEMIDYSTDVLKHRDVNYFSRKLPSPNLGVDILSTREEWNEILKSGKGTLKVAPTMKLEGNKITITALPSSKNADKVRKIVEKEILLDKIDFIDESTHDICIVIEKVKNKSCDMQELYKRLYNKLCSNEKYSFAFFDDNNIFISYGYPEVVRRNLMYLMETHNNRLSKQIPEAEAKLRVLEVIQQLNVKDISEKTYDESVEYLIKKFNVDKDIASKVLAKPISYLTKAHTKEIEELKNLIKELTEDKNDLYEFLIKKFKELKSRVTKSVNIKPTNFIKEN